jgi:hypothetical protein
MKDCHERLIRKAKANMSRYDILAARGEEYSSYSFLTSAVDGVSWQRHAPAALYPWESTPVPTGLGGPRSWSGRRGYREKSFKCAGYRTPVLQSVVLPQLLSACMVSSGTALLYQLQSELLIVSLNKHQINYRMSARTYAIMKASTYYVCALLTFLPTRKLFKIWIDAN